MTQNAGVPAGRLTVGEAVLQVERGDITRLDTDAIVNAADRSLSVGGGVSGAIHRAGGHAIEAECRAWVAEHGLLPTGDAMITTGGRLPARHVIHTVGPIWSGGIEGEPDLLARAYQSSIALADEHGLVSVAFPSVSTGIYGYPVALAAPVALGALARALQRAEHVRLVRVVLFSDDALSAYVKALEALRGDRAGSGGAGCGPEGEPREPWW